MTYINELDSNGLPQRDTKFYVKTKRDRWAPPNVRGKRIVERETGVEPATSTLARWRSTTELFPLGEREG